LPMPGGTLRNGVEAVMRRYALHFALKLQESHRKGTNHAGVGCKPSANLMGLSLHLTY
jgi:hypothetical protein